MKRGAAFILAALFSAGVLGVLTPSLINAATFDLPNISCPEGITCPTVSNEEVRNNPAAYIARLYQIVLAISGVLAVGIIVTGSLFYTFAGGSTDRQRKGKEMITSALWGIALLFGSYLVLKTVNPRLTESFGFIGGPPHVETPTFSAGENACSLFTVTGINCIDKNYVERNFGGDRQKCNAEADKKYAEKLESCQNHAADYGTGSSYPGGGYLAYDKSDLASPAVCHPVYKYYSQNTAAHTTENDRNVPFNPAQDDGVYSGWKKGTWGFCQ